MRNIQRSFSTWLNTEITNADFDILTSYYLTINCSIRSKTQNNSNETIYHTVRQNTSVVNNHVLHIILQVLTGKHLKITV